MIQETDLSWRFINSGRCEPAFNMALDEALMRAAAARCSTATLRVYAWSRPSVSLGYHQRLEHRLDPECCRDSGIEVVRRITGGREVFHDSELTYSFSGPEGHPRLGKNIAESYRAIAAGLMHALRLLGVEPELMRPAVGRNRAGSKKEVNPCFSSASRYEISVQGKKLVGSAQRRCPNLGAFLQQGSLLIRNSQDRLLDLLPRSRRDQQTIDKSARSGSRATGLEEVLGRKVEFEEVARAMRSGFEQAFGCRFAEEKPSGQELNLALELERRKYSCTNWVEGQTRRVVSAVD